MIATIASSTTTATMSASMSQGTFLPATGAVAGTGVWATGALAAAVAGPAEPRTSAYIPPVRWRVPAWLVV